MSQNDVIDKQRALCNNRTDSTCLPKQYVNVLLVVHAMIVIICVIFFMYRIYQYMSDNNNDVSYIGGRIFIDFCCTIIAAISLRYVIKYHNLT